MLIGAIGDDFTGSGDLANMIARAGLDTRLYAGDLPASAGGEAAAVVALKTRTLPVAEAVAQSRAAVGWLRRQGAGRILFKYCSTFDSTPEGNIGPVAEALAEDLGAGKVLFVPSFPETGRTVYQGHLFVGDRLLSETGMRDHPLYDPVEVLRDLMGADDERFAVAADIVVSIRGRVAGPWTH